MPPLVATRPLSERNRRLFSNFDSSAVRLSKAQGHAHAEWRPGLACRYFVNSGGGEIEKS